LSTLKFSTLIPFPVHFYDLIVEQVGKEVGAERIGRCAAPNDNPLFIQALADIVQVRIPINHYLRSEFDDQTNLKSTLLNFIFLRFPILLLSILTL
jgi:hypothetical protein